MTVFKPGEEYQFEDADLPWLRLAIHLLYSQLVEGTAERLKETPEKLVESIEAAGQKALTEIGNYFYDREDADLLYLATAFSIGKHAYERYMDAVGIPTAIPRGENNGTDLQSDSASDLDATGGVDSVRR